MAQRDGGGRVGRRDRRAVQPGRAVHGVHRRGAVGGRTGRRREWPAIVDGEAEDDEPDEVGDGPATAGGHGDPYAAAADSWAASQDDGPVAGEQDAARRLYDLALSYQERSQRSEADLVERFQVAAGRYTTELGELLVVESDEERLVLQAGGTFRAEVEAEDDEDAHAGEATPAGEWLVLSTPEELVGFYDPTDVFGDLADALAEAFPAVAPPVTGDASADAHPDSAGEGDDRG